MGRRRRPQALALDRHVKGWFDCVVGCAAAASIEGVERIGAAVQWPGERKRLKLSDLQAKRR